MFDITKVFEILGAAAGLAAILVVIFPRQERKYAAVLFGFLSVGFLGIDYWQTYYVHRIYIEELERNVLGKLKGRLLAREQIQLELDLYRLDPKDLDEALNHLSVGEKIMSTVEDAHLDKEPRPAVKVTIFTGR